MNRFGDKRDDFFKKKFGMFIHWGIYAVHGYHEQEIYRLCVPRLEYEAIAGLFNPTGFDPDDWVKTAKSCGMEYIVLTAKHIDGFCMWDSKFTRFNIMNSPYGKDVVKMLADACAKSGLGFGVYYSCADMNHPNYPNCGRSYEYRFPQEGDRPDLALYMEYVKNQITELCINYGELTCFFWDANMTKHEDLDVNNIIRKLQPGAVINDRGYDCGDYGTPERDYQRDALEAIYAFERPTEACQALGMESWGWRENEKYYSGKYIMQSMARVFSYGGNYLLNVGPDAKGFIGAKEKALLSKIGGWREKVKAAYINSEPASVYIKTPGILAAREGNSLYLSCMSDLPGDSAQITPLTATPKRAVLLNDGRELSVSRGMGVRDWNMPMEYVRINGIPVEELYGEVAVIRLDFDSFPFKDSSKENETRHNTCAEKNAQL